MNLGTGTALTWRPFPQFGRIIRVDHTDKLFPTKAEKGTGGGRTKFRRRVHPTAKRFFCAETGDVEESRVLRPKFGECRICVFEPRATTKLRQPSSSRRVNAAALTVSTNMAVRAQGYSPGRGSGLARGLYVIGTNGRKPAHRQPTARPRRPAGRSGVLAFLYFTLKTP